jgi:hypothetical protein
MYTISTFFWLDIAAVCSLGSNVRLLVIATLDALAIDDRLTDQSINE